jgi:hypothetical protein
LAKELLKTLDGDQKQIAHLDKQFPEIQGQTSEPKVGDPKGLSAAKMTDLQRRLLEKLLQAYADRMPADIAQAEMNEVREAGLDHVHFAYSGGVEPGTPYSYRIQGPSFVIEFLNVQSDSAMNPANHIHSAWRHVSGDFGLNQ